MEYTIKEYMTSDQLIALYNQGYRTFILPIELMNKTFSAHDADTISLKGESDKRASGSFRFIGINAPELHQTNSLTGEPIGKIATNRINELMSGAKYLRIETNGLDNRAKRLMGTVYTDTGLDINLQLLKEGQVRFYERYKESIPNSMLSEYEQAGVRAQTMGKLAYAPGTEDPETWAHKHKNDPSTPEPNTQPKQEQSYVKPIPTFQQTYGDLYDSASLPKEEDKKSTLSYLSRLYEHYYSSADCTVYLINPDDGKTVQVDLISGIGYDYNVSSMPVYTIGSRFPAFFTNGNSLGTGTLVLPFKSQLYLKTMINYLFDTDERISTEIPNTNVETASDETFQLFAKYKATNVVDTPDIIDIGSIISSIDIKIVFNNSNAFYNDDSDKIIILRGCKFISENLEVLSTRDGTIQQGYKFLFKTTSSGK